jgi:hypothetical protein
MFIKTKKAILNTISSDLKNIITVIKIKDKFGDDEISFTSLLKL